MDTSALARAALSAAMNRYADGQDSAFGEVYDLFAPRLYGFFVRHTGETSRAEDLVQQTMLQMHAARTSFALGSDAVPWAFAIGRRLLIDSRRRTRKEVLFETAQDDAAALDHRVERFAVPDALAISKEQVRVFHGTYAEPYERVGYRCLGLTLVMAATPLAAFLRFRRGVEPRRPSILGAAAGAACGAWAGVVVDLWCPLTAPAHALVGHALPLALLVGVGALLGRRMLGVLPLEHER